MSGARTVLDTMAGQRRELGPAALLARTPDWRLAQDEAGIAWLIFDREGESANTITEASLRELAGLIARIEELRPKGVVLRSAKPSGFAAGADVRAFRGVADAAAVRERIAAAHAVVDRIERLPLPTVAVLHGICLGGGLELALACRHRIAVAGARLGLPEVLLGLHPGLGGTGRMTRLIEPIQAMRLMLTGRTVEAARARRLGLVDAVVEERHVAAAVAAAVGGRLKRRRQGLLQRLENLRPARRAIAARMAKETARRARPEHYPAPFALIELWRDHGGSSSSMRQAEIDSFAGLLGGAAAQSLIGVFFLRERLKRLAKGEAGVRHVHVVGAGTMGGDIAAWCAAEGLSVSLADLNPEVLAAAVGRAEALFRRRFGDGARARDARDRLLPDFAGDGVGRADLVIEAVPERLELKQKLFQSLENRLKPDAILASNTSSIPLDRLAEGLARPERLVGLHFFNPVDRMLLVEVVRHAGADPAALARAQAFCGLIDRLPAPVASAPGFLVNRVLTPYLLEAMLLLDQGIAAETIDRAATDFGMAMGPVEVADRVGLDVCLHVAEVLRQALPQPLPEVPAWLKTRVADGQLGTKSGKGLYDWEAGRPKRRRDAPAPEQGLAERLILPLLNTSVACLREGVAEDAGLIDAGIVFATGFAPFTGGPLNYARTRGIGEVVAALQRLADAHGPRFAPDPGWARLSGET
jgi:3-hydroxyacyl-CoA dehydrogenase/enoyl-CoA hydratase/3-hydroxybutyryl-CoA epimerase